MTGKKEDRAVKRTHNLFIDDLKDCQENHQKLEVLNGIIVQASRDTGAVMGKEMCRNFLQKE